MKLKPLILGLATVGVVLSGQLLAVASSKESATSALAKAPQGIEIDSYFEIGHIANNSAVVTDTGHGSKQAVLLTDATMRPMVGTSWGRFGPAMPPKWT